MPCPSLPTPLLVHSLHLTVSLVTNTRRRRERGDRALRDEVTREWRKREAYGSVLSVPSLSFHPTEGRPLRGVRSFLTHPPCGANGMSVG